MGPERGVMSENGSKDYEVNFFKPKTDHAKANMKVVVVMILLWAVAVFGFQVALLVLQKPTAEPTLAAYEKVAGAVTAGTAKAEEKQAFAKSLLMVLGKNIVLKEKDKKVLKNTLSATVVSLDAAAASDAEAASKAIGLGDKDYDPLLKSILASSLAPVDAKTLEADMKALPAVMKLYLTHNQSVLTDTPFLGFPFHYWYTAQFLLILFVGLCWVFCKMTDNSNHKFNLETD